MSKCPFRLLPAPGANLHLDTACFATPTDDHYISGYQTPGRPVRFHGWRLGPDTGAKFAEHETRCR